MDATLTRSPIETSASKGGDAARPHPSSRLHPRSPRATAASPRPRRAEAPAPDGPDWHALVAALGRQPGADADVVAAALPIVRAAVRGVAGPGDVDDAVQDALMAVLRDARSVRDPQAMPRWIGVVARRAALAVVRRRRSLDPMDLDDLAQLPDDQVIDLDDLHDRLDAGEVFDLLECLTEGERALVRLLVDRPDLSYAELAARLHRPVGSLGPTRRRALAKMRAAASRTVAGQPASV